MRLRHLAKRGDHVAQPRGPLVVALLRCTRHLGDKLVERLGARAAEKRAGLLETLPVFSLGYPPKARCRARPYDIRAAVAVALGIGLDRVASAKPPPLLRKVLRHAHNGAGRERPEVPRAVVAHYSAADQARPLRRGVGAEREIALVVAHEDVEARLVLLYERRLREKRLLLVLHGHHLEVPHSIDHRAHLGSVSRAGAEVLRDAPLEVLRLAHVNYRAPAISHEIAAGAVGQVLHPLPYEVARHATRALSRARPPSSP